MSSEGLSHINVDQLSSAVSGLLASVSVSSVTSSSSSAGPVTSVSVTRMTSVSVTPTLSANSVSGTMVGHHSEVGVENGCSATSAVTIGRINADSASGQAVSNILNDSPVPLMVSMPSSTNPSPSDPLVPIAPKKNATYTAIESFSDSTVMFIRSADDTTPPSQLFAEQAQPQAVKIIIDSNDGGQSTLISNFSQQDECDDVVYQVVLSEPQSESNDIVENHEPELPDQIIMSAYCIECNRVWKSGCPEHIHTYTHVPDSSVYSRAITTLPSILQLQRSEEPSAPYFVVANVDVEARTVFGPLEGKRLTDESGSDLHGNDPHHWQIFDSQGAQGIDCTDESISNWLMFLQRASRNSDQNLVAYQHGSDVYFVCRQKISAGEQLRYWFSSDYAQLLGVSQSPEPVYSCSQCQREFESSKHLSSHVARSHQQCSVPKEHLCCMCQKAFLSASKLKEHMLIHSGERSHKCPSCNKSFTLASNLKMHLRLHTNVKSFACKVCNRTFTQRAHLENHLLVHTKIKRHECEYCQMKFARPYDMRIHINCQHLKEKSYPCTECSSVFYKLQALKRHLARHAANAKKKLKHQCPKCGAQFRWKIKLKRHTCDGESPEETHEKESTWTENCKT